MRLLILLTILFCKQIIACDLVYFAKDSLDFGQCYHPNKHRFTDSVFCTNPDRFVQDLHFSFVSSDSIEEDLVELGIPKDQKNRIIKKVKKESDSHSFSITGVGLSRVYPQQIETEFYPKVLKYLEDNSLEKLEQRYGKVFLWNMEKANFFYLQPPL